MSESHASNEVTEQVRKSRLKVIVIAHLVIVISFFVAAFIWGNFA